MGLFMRSLLFSAIVLCTEGYTSKQTNFLNARCKARCLSIFQRDFIHIRKTSKQNHGISTSTLEQCLQSLNCTACLKPCDQTFRDETTKECQSHCQSTICRESCTFLERISSHKQGHCPAASNALGSSCIVECRSDFNECPEDLRCCPNNGCGFTCQKPVFIGVPPVPKTVTATGKKNGNSLELSWSMDANQNISYGPTVYIIQQRHHVGATYDPRQMSEWQSITQTTGLRTTIRRISAGIWYEYRVAAVNINGTNKFSHKSIPFRLKREPRRPSEPMNLTEGETTIHKNRIDVSLHWLPPRYTDLPVSRYKLFWSRRLKSVSPTYVSLKEHKKAVSGRKTTFTLRNLEPDTTYFVQIQTMCRYGPQKLKSKRVSMYITTYPLDGASKPTATMESNTIVAPSDPSLPRPGPVEDVAVQLPFFHNGKLKALVHWKYPKGTVKVNKYSVHWSLKKCLQAPVGSTPQVMSATTHDTSFNLYDLQFNCVYGVNVQPATVAGAVGPVSSTEFTTPQCHIVIVKGKRGPSNCPTSKYTAPPEPPGNLHHSFHIERQNITAIVRWQMPVSHANVKGFHITWGKRSPNWFPGGKSVLNKNRTTSQYLTQDHLSVKLSKLEEGASYIFKVQTLTKGSKSKVAEILITTPMLTQYFHINNDDSSINSHTDSNKQEPVESQHNSALRTFTTNTLAVCLVFTTLYKLLFSGG